MHFVAHHCLNGGFEIQSVLVIVAATKWWFHSGCGRALASAQQLAAVGAWPEHLLSLRPSPDAQSQAVISVGCSVRKGASSPALPQGYEYNHRWMLRAVNKSSVMQRFIQCIPLPRPL